MQEEKIVLNSWAQLYLQELAGNLSLGNFQDKKMDSRKRLSVVYIQAK